MIVFVHGADLVAHLAEREDPLIVEGERDETHENLARWLARYCEAADWRAVLVWDEAPPGDVRTPTERRGRLKVLNLPYGERALSEIGGPANRQAVDERTFVVTADPRLRDAMAGGRATVMTPAQFVARVRRTIGRGADARPDEPDEKFAGLADEEVGFWLEYFKDPD